MGLTGSAFLYVKLGLAKERGEKDDSVVYQNKCSRNKRVSTVVRSFLLPEG